MGKENYNQSAVPLVNEGVYKKVTEGLVDKYEERGRPNGKRKEERKTRGTEKGRKKETQEKGMTTAEGVNRRNGREWDQTCTSSEKEPYTRLLLGKKERTPIPVDYIPGMDGLSPRT